MSGYSFESAEVSDDTCLLLESCDVDRCSHLGLFNPAVTLGLAMIGAIGWVRAGLVFIAEILGAMASAGVVSALFPGPLNVATTLSGDTSVARGLCELILFLPPSKYA